jgi:hypothetical protein
MDTMTKYAIIATVSLFITTSLSSGSFILLFLYDKKFDLSNNLFTFSSTLLSALLGGYIAYFASKKQISANSKNELLKELKKETTGCLVAMTELKTTLNRLQKVETGTKYKDLSNLIDISYLETFRQEYLYLLDKEEVDLFLSVINRIKLIKLNITEKEIDGNKFVKLISDCTSLLKNFEDLYISLSSLRESIKNMS